MTAFRQLLRRLAGPRTGYFIESAVRTDDGRIIGMAELQPLRRRVTTYRSDHSDWRITYGLDEQSNRCLDIVTGHRTVNIALSPWLHRSNAVRRVRDLLEP